MKYAYVRVSTTAEKQDISRQLRYAKNNGVEEKNIFIDYASGSKVERKDLNRLLAIVKEEDEVYTSDVSRLTRSLKHLIQLVDFAKEKKIKMVFGDFVIDCRNTLSALTEGQLLMLGLVAELMRLIIVENVKDGLATAKENGKRLGRPKFNKDKDIPDEFYRYYNMYLNKEINKKELSKLSGKSRPTIDSWIKNSFKNHKNN